MGTDASAEGLILSDDHTLIISFTPPADCGSVEIPDSVVSLPDGLFSDCSSLKSVKLPRFVRVLPDRLFENCTLLTKIQMPAEVDAFGFATFSGCASLKTVPFRAGLSELPSEVFSCCTSLTSLIIPDTVRAVRRGAVSGCTSLETVVLPAALETLEKEAFTGCTSLRHIRMAQGNQKYRVDDSNGCLYERQEDGIELIVLSPVEFERFSAKLTDDISVPVPVSGSGNETDDDGDTVEFVNREHGGTVEKGSMQNTHEDSSDEIARRTAEIMAGDSAPADEGIEPVSEAELRMLSAESEILSQNTPVNGNPVVLTQDEVDKAVSSGDVMRTYDESYFGPPVKRPSYPVSEQEAGERLPEDPMIARISSAAERYEIFELKKDMNKPVWNDCLYVFAENLVFDEDGDGHFSDALVSCCRRIARIHGYLRVRLYYGIPLENEEFAQLFSEFISERSTIYACSAPSTAKLSEFARRFCAMAGISLEKNMIELENTLAGSEDANILKMILQDDYSA